MLFKTIDFPLELLQAQKDHRLVVFAGAGISMPPPSNLPDFAGLAKIIGQGAASMLEDETEDGYLGRLYNEGRGLQVHTLAAGVLLDGNSQPTDLHTQIIQLFGRNGPIRIVTTNFENHFASAAARLGLGEFKSFLSPALPLGDDFEGIVCVNTASGVYHMPGARWYGRTEEGQYMTEDAAIRAGDRKSRNGE